MTEIPKTVTRVVIVATNGLVAREHFAESFDVHIQDDGRTVKLFAKGDGGKARNERNAALGEDLVNGMRGLSDLARQRGEVVEDWHGKNHSYPRSEPF